MGKLDTRLEELETMTKRDLKDRWAQLTGRPVPRVSEKLLRLALAYELQAKTLGGLLRLVGPGGSEISANVDQPLLGLLVKARTWWSRLEDGETTIAMLAREEGVNDSWISRVVRANFPAPDLVVAILEGRQPAHLDAKSLTSRGSMPMQWDEQREQLGSP